MRVAYVNYGSQSGVTRNILDGLARRGHDLLSVDPTFVLELKMPGRRLPRPTPRVLAHLAAAALQHGSQALDQRWNTPFAFDTFSRTAGTLLGRLRPVPDVVLQNGCLFAPGAPPRLPYVLLCDNTCRLSASSAGLGEPVRYGEAWLRRERATYAGARGIAVFSEVVKRSLVDDYGVPEGRVVVVGAGANVEPRPRAHDGRTLLFIGKGLWLQKGGPVLLRAFELVRREVPDARLRIVGQPQLANLADGVENVGLLPMEAVSAELARATAFVLPTMREPFGIAFLDAMRAGVPCVGTEQGAIPEILDHGRAGLLVPVADAVALARAMRELLTNPERATALGEAGRRRIEERGYLWPQVAARLSNLLETAAAPDLRAA